MKAETLVVQVAGLPAVKDHIERLEWRIDCLEQMLRHPFCTSCGMQWTTSACGPTHAAIAANHPLFAAPTSGLTSPEGQG